MSKSAIVSSSASFSVFGGPTAASRSRRWTTRPARTTTSLRYAQSIYNEMYDLPIFVIDKRGMTVVDIRAKARKVKAEHPNLSLIIIDYLQLIKPPPGVNKNWALVVGDIVREIRDLAGELDLPIILLSQLNRSVESRGTTKSRSCRTCGTAATSKNLPTW